MAKIQQTVVLIKPDGLQRGLVGEIMSRFEKKGLKLVGLKMLRMTDEILDEWYAHHKDKPFFPKLKGFMKWTPIVAMLWEGNEAISVVRKLVGSTAGYEAEAGSIRGDFGISHQQNLIHASDSEEGVEKERKLIFDENEVFEYESVAEVLILSAEERIKK